MPGGPDYPHDTSPHFPLSVKESIVTPLAFPSIQGVIHSPSGDISTWVVAQATAKANRNLITALAYLDVADIQRAEMQRQLDTFSTALEQVQRTLVEQADLLRQVTGLLGVEIPAWPVLGEVAQGDDMGMIRPSAAELGLSIVIIAVPNHPTFSDFQIISSVPSAGTLVLRGTTVRLHAVISSQGSADLAEEIMRLA